MDNQLVINELVRFLMNNIEKDEQWGVTGNFLNEVLYDFTDIHFLSFSNNLKNAQKILKRGGCHLMYSVDETQYYEKAGVLVILSAFEGNQSPWIPLDIINLNRGRCDKYIIPYFEDIVLFVENFEKQLSIIFDNVVKLVMSHKREDLLMININLSEFKNNTLILLNYIEKNGYDIGQFRIRPFINSKIYPELLKSYVEGYYSNIVSLEKIFEECNVFLCVINVLIYEIEQITEKKIDVTGLNDFLFSQGLEENVFHPIKDDIFSKYSKALSEVYDNSRDDYKLWGLLRNTLYDLVSDKNVMELGVGTGMIAEKIIPLTKTYIGLEYSEDMMAVFRRKCQKYGYRQASFILGDMMNIDMFDVANIDVFLERASLMFCMDPLTVIRKLERIAKKDSLLIRIDFEEEDSLLNEWLAIFDASIVSYDKRPIVLKEYDDIQLVNHYFEKHEKPVEIRKLFTWQAKVKIIDFIENLKRKYLPYMQVYSDDAVSFGIERIMATDSYKKKVKNEIISIPKTAYAYISTI